MDNLTTVNVNTHLLTIVKECKKCIATSIKVLQVPVFQYLELLLSINIIETLVCEQPQVSAIIGEEVEYMLIASQFFQNSVNVWPKHLHP